MAVTFTPVLALGTAAASSSEISVDAGSTKKLQIWCSDGGLPQVAIPVLEKNSAGGFVPVMFEGKGVILGANSDGQCTTSVLLPGPGVYRADRPVVTAGEAVALDVLS